MEHAVALVYQFFQFVFVRRVRHLGIQRVKLFFQLVKIVKSRFEVFDYRLVSVDVGMLIEIIVSYAAADKNSLYTFNFTYLTENVKIFLMIYLKIFAWLRRKALSALAQTVFQLMCAGGARKFAVGPPTSWI